MKRTIASILSFAFVVFIAWYAGLDFQNRGFMQAYLIFCAAGAAFGTYIFPFWEEDK